MKTEDALHRLAYRCGTSLRSSAQCLLRPPFDVRMVADRAQGVIVTAETALGRRRNRENSIADFAKRMVARVCKPAGIALLVF